MLLKSEGGDGILAWDDIQHFVVLPNYKEDIDTLREALDTVGSLYNHTYNHIYILNL